MILLFRSFVCQPVQTGVVECSRYTHVYVLKKKKASIFQSTSDYKQPVYCAADLVLPMKSWHAALTITVNPMLDYKLVSFGALLLLFAPWETWILYPRDMFKPTPQLCSRIRRLPLTTKQTGKGYYKGNRTGSMGRHTKHGKYVIDYGKVRTYCVPNLSNFPVSMNLLSSALSSDET